MTLTRILPACILASAGLMIACSQSAPPDCDFTTDEDVKECERMLGTRCSSLIPNYHGIQPMKLEQGWDKVFSRSDKVTQIKVTFNNRFGFTLVADMYIPKDSRGKKLPAIAVSGPFGAVKEQSSGLYAQTLAERGFITLAFDPSYTGESGGVPRDVATPDINTEDFSAAVDYLANHENINPDAIGILGICGWGGIALNAAAVDTRIKATVSSTMYDMTRVIGNGYFDADDNPAARNALRKSLNDQRTAEYQTAKPEHAGGVVSELKGDEPQFVKDYHDYYKTDRGYHKRSLNSNDGWNKTSAISFLNARFMYYIHEISTPVLLIHGEKAHSRYFSETAFEKMTGKHVENTSDIVGNKELMIIPDASHVDLYDNMDKIPFDKIELFYKNNLK